jgi:hypothetical protein
MLHNIVLFITLFSYAVIVSQSFMYILSLRNATLGLGANSYTELRQLIDANMRARFKWPTYAALASSLVWMIMNIQAPSGLLFITAVIALAGLVIDVAFTLKRSLPLNDIINNWTTTNYPDNWREIRQQWLDSFQYRQIVNITGFTSLLIGAVWG